MPDTESTVHRIGRALLSRSSARLGEIAVLFAVPIAVITLVLPFTGDNLLAKQGVVWIANVLMLLIIWAGLRLRGQGWAHLGMPIRKPSRGDILSALWKSVIVFVLAMIGFIFGSIVMANIVGIPEPADMSGYNYMYGNLPLLLISLLGVYIVSSIGEEAIYRGFLITRIQELSPDTRRIRVIAVLASALIFGLIHYDWGPMGVGQTTFMGLVLAITYLKTGRNLWINILAHAYMDTILIAQMYFLE